MKPLSDVFSPEVMAELARPVQTYDPRDAELVPNITPAWFLIEVFSNKDNAVAAELAKRRFGIFIPQTEDTIIHRGRKVDRVQLMFPGYIFVFVWDVLEHRSRLEAIDGVLRLIMDVNGIPLAIPDEMVDEVRAIGTIDRRLYTVTRAKPRVQKVRSRKIKKMRETELSKFQQSVITALDSEERNQSLRKAVSLS